MAIKRATVADVARESYVSQMTVSPELNEDVKVKAETHDKILAAIKKINYVPNMSGSLMSELYLTTSLIIIPLRFVSMIIMRRLKWPFE